MQRKLDFVIAGTQKGGTTTLDAIFRRHRQIQMTNVKETHFFDDESLNWVNPDYARLEATFMAADERRCGEATPVTLYWKPAIRRLQAYDPNVKLICLLRSPIERTFSNWRKEYAEGFETMTFGDAIRAGRSRVSRQAEIDGLHRRFSYVERSLYGEQIEYLLNFFPLSQVHFEISEEFFHDRRAGLQRLSDFLGVEAFPDDLPHLHENPGRKLDYPSTLTGADINYLAGLFRDDVKKTEELLGRSIPAWRQSVSG